MSDNGRSVEELLAAAHARGAVDNLAVDGSASATLPVERLTNFMDVCAPTELTVIHPHPHLQLLIRMNSLKYSSYSYLCKNHKEMTAKLFYKFKIWTV